MSWKQLFVAVAVFAFGYGVRSAFPARTAPLPIEPQPFVYDRVVVNRPHPNPRPDAPYYDRREITELRVNRINLNDRDPVWYSVEGGDGAWTLEFTGPDGKLLYSVKPLRSSP